MVDGNSIHSDRRKKRARSEKQRGDHKNVWYLEEGDEEVLLLKIPVVIVPS